MPGTGQQSWNQVHAQPSLGIRLIIEPMGFQRPFREDRDRAEEEKSEEEGQRGRVYCKGVSADLRGQHCYHHYWYSSERCSFLSLSLFSSRLFTMGHDIIPRRYTTPSLIDRLERERKEGRRNGGSYKFSRPFHSSSLCIFFIHRRNRYTSCVLVCDTTHGGRKSVG